MNGNLLNMVLLAHMAAGPTDLGLQPEQTTQPPEAPAHKTTPPLKIIIPSNTSPNNSPQDQTDKEQLEHRHSQDDTSPVNHRHNQYSPTFISLMKTRN